MPANPKGSLGNCTTCRMIASAVKKTANNLRKNFLVYSIFYVLLLEIASIFIVQSVSEERYNNFYYPLINNIDFAVLFFNLFFYRNHLKFCLRKNIAVFSMAIYFVFNAYAVFFKLQQIFYYSAITYFLLGIVAVTLVLSLIKKSK